MRMRTRARATALSDELMTCFPNEALTVSRLQTSLPRSAVATLNLSFRADLSAACSSALSTAVWIWKPAWPELAMLAVCWICASP